MTLQLKGKMYRIYPTEQYTERFKKREFVLDISEEKEGRVYANYAKIQLVQNRCELLDNFSVGDDVIVSFNVRGVKWEKDGKESFINTVDAWRIEKQQM